jgi:hypothetical protein
MGDRQCNANAMSATAKAKRRTNVAMFSVCSTRPGGIVSTGDEKPPLEWLLYVAQAFGQIVNTILPMC